MGVLGGVSCTYFWHFFSKQISIFENGYRQVQLPWKNGNRVLGKIINHNSTNKYIYKHFSTTKYIWIHLYTSSCNYMCNQGYLESDRLICMHLDITMGNFAQLQSSGFICLHLGATMYNQWHLGSNRLIYTHLDIF